MKCLVCGTDIPEEHRSGPDRIYCCDSCRNRYYYRIRYGAAISMDDKMDGWDNLRLAILKQAVNDKALHRWKDTESFRELFPELEEIRKDL